MKITIDISSSEAETILFALAMRSKQKSIPPEFVTQTIELSERLNKTFETNFGWMEFDRTKHNRKPIKHVSIKCYDFPPAE